MPDDEQWLAVSLHLDDHGFDARDHVQVALAAGVSVRQFVGITTRKLLYIYLYMA